jgi:hypothetical protein
VDRRKGIQGITEKGGNGSMSIPVQDTTVSTGATVKDDPGGYLHALVLDTEFDDGREKHDDNMHDCCKLAADVFAKIHPDDYGPILLAALQSAAPDIVNDYLDYVDEAEAGDGDEDEPALRCEHEIGTAAEEFADRLWYHRSLHWSPPVTSEHPSYAGMMAARREAEDKYGEDNLTGLGEFDLGMISGKLSALRWVLGDEWDFLDT